MSLKELKFFAEQILDTPDTKMCLRLCDKLIRLGMPRQRAQKTAVSITVGCLDDDFLDEVATYLKKISDKITPELGEYAYHEFISELPVIHKDTPPTKPTKKYR